MTNFEEIYLVTADNLKLKFLQGVIAQNGNLQKEFMAFIQTENIEISSLSYDDFLDLIQFYQAEYKEYFEEVDLENPDWENYHSPHSGYVEEWEAYQCASEQEFESIFSRFFSIATDLIIKQKTEEFLAMLIGLYEATQDAEIADEVGSFEDVNEYLLSAHANTMSTLIERLKLSAVSENLILKTFELFFCYCDSEYPANAHFANHFEQLLTTLAEKSDYTDHLLSIIDQSAVERQFLPELILLLNKKSGNIAEWQKSALQFYRHSAEVAKQLLEYYFETNKKAFNGIALELFSTDKNLWAEFLQQYVSPQLDKGLFISVFRQLIIQKKEIVYYNKIRNYLNESDINDLINELKWDKAFIVKLLEVEKRYQDIKALVEQYPGDLEYAEMITPILTIYPEFCFTHIQSKTEKILKNQRGRSVYERIVSWLLLIQKIPGFEMEKLNFVKKLYTHKPNLPALKDEIRKAGLVK